MRTEIRKVGGELSSLNEGVGRQQKAEIKRVRSWSNEVNEFPKYGKFCRKWFMKGTGGQAQNPITP